MLLVRLYTVLLNPVIVLEVTNRLLTVSDNNRFDVVDLSGLIYRLDVQTVVIVRLDHDAKLSVPLSFQFEVVVVALLEPTASVVLLATARLVFQGACI